MIITKISGGLGNQMFQYATGRILALKNSTTLKLDISSYASDKFGRHYSLEIFNIKATIATADEIRKLKPVDNFFIQKSPRLFKLASNLTKSYINEKFTGGKISKDEENLYLDGFWQNEKYFIEFTDQIRQDFKLKPRPDKNVAGYLKKIKTTDSVSIHVRRGDYVSIARIGQGVGICGVKYYQRAIKFITKKTRNPVFFIFSEADGLDWVKQNLKFESPLVLVKSSKDYEDLRLMSLCQHNIVANSSFSWWGAWLNENPKKIIVAPDPWFNNKKTDIIPHGWFKVAKED